MIWLSLGRITSLSFSLVQGWAVIEQGINSAVVLFERHDPQTKIW